ncbi:MAG: binding-protein-dependent transport system inner rane component [Thermomicrobiales bacterium]|jgi:peptide/nickel transport system permease protein|nr:binding-protein-dependent transport system inner rane component [Thermomicrobiales bacterium]MDF2757594.1 binding-protein-dependent transport system inner rane component [Thermomicrobiales bacterium]MDF3014901.1 binding-protein-dependent transport system inner rane component [Thermomicrobiales bacterium]
MGSYVFNRLLQFVPTLFVVSVVVFLMVRAIPGDASYALLGPTAKPEQIAALRAEMGLDEPIWRQYLVWIEGVLHGDLGRSWINDFPVADLIRQKLPATIVLAVGSMAIAVLIAIPMGILPALRPGSWIERVAALYNGLMLAIPTFWLGVLLVLVISLRLGWLPPSGYVPFGEDPVQSIKLLILPSFTLGAYLSAIFARFLHNAMTETLSQDYVRTAAAKGLAERLVVRRHVLRNALIPVVTMLGIQFGGLLGGAVIVEAIFDWPGLGRLLVTSISSRDYAVVQGTILLAASAFLFVNLLTDLTYGLLDPRIRTAE